MLLWFSLKTKVRQHRKAAFGPATIDPVLLHVLEEAGLTRARIKRLWRGVVLRNRVDTIIVERIARSRVRMGYAHDAEMSACIPLAPGVHWAERSIRFSQRGMTIPETVADLLGGRPVSDVIEHPGIPRDATFTDRADPYMTNFMLFMSYSGRGPDPHEGMVLETDCRPATLPRTSYGAFGHWAWRLRRTWSDFREDLPDRAFLRKVVRGNLWVGGVCSTFFAGLAWYATGDPLAALMRTPWVLMGSFGGLLIGMTMFLGYAVIRRPSQWKMRMEHEKWLAEEMERQLF
jgi:hypothetical protein